MKTQTCLLAVFLAGCATTPKSQTTANDQRQKAQIEHRLNQIFDAAEKKDFERLESYHLYGPGFTKFAPESPTRMDAAAARKGEQDGLQAVSDLYMKARDLKIDVFNNTGIATFMFDYGFTAGTNTVQKQARATLVFVKESGEWKITHEHFSPAK
jgi:ketosteroid isomerase-like protein